MVNHFIGIDPGVSGFASVLTYNDNGSMLGYSQYRLRPDVRHQFFQWLRGLKYYRNTPQGLGKVVIVHEETEKFVGNYAMKSSAGVTYGESCGFLKGALSEILQDTPWYWEVLRPKVWMAEFQMKRIRANRRTNTKGEATGVWKKRLRDKAFEELGHDVNCSIPAADSLLLAILAHRRDPEIIC